MFLSEAILFLIIYGIPVVLIILLIVKVLYPIVKHIDKKFSTRKDNYIKWYESLTPEEQMLEELRGMNGTRFYSILKHSKDKK